jgi:error-prone DNA polymerase
VYAELHCLTHYSFLRGASAPEELVGRAASCGYYALAIADECSLAGVVKAHVAAKERGLKLIIGSEFTLTEGIRLVALVPSREAYGELSGLISRARRRSGKGEYCVHLRDVIFHLKRCLLILLPDDTDNQTAHLQQLTRRCKGRVWIGISRLLGNDEWRRFKHRYHMAQNLQVPMVACGEVQMHSAKRKALHDVLTAIRLQTPVQQLGHRRLINSQQHLRTLDTLLSLYPETLIDETRHIADRCQFSLDELRYEYPEEVVPSHHTANSYLRQEVAAGGKLRWPDGVPEAVQTRIHQELDLITELSYEYYFLTVYDIVRFAKSRHILCQGRGSAANSVVCYCLHITEVSPEQVSLLFERFISRERDEPPDIDVDFEHERREEVIQYIYEKYSRRRAALAATVITYRSRSAVRDVGKAMGFDASFIDELASSLAWWNREKELTNRFQQQGLARSGELAEHFMARVQEILGFPRHLSQHVGGFVISRGPISNLVPVENASMPDRTVIQWDKEDIEALGLLKVDILALGMLSAIRKSLEMISRDHPDIRRIQDIPREDAATYRMLQKADSLGVFQIESRAQMSMLPRLKPACFYDLVIEIAIVRPGPIQGDMVHPYLRRKAGLEAISYPNKDIESVLSRTLGVPIFQEQVIRLAMVAAGFTGGEADALRRAISNWGKNSKLLSFEHKLKQGMINKGYTADFADRLFNQIKGFGGYGFPESHSASFALLAYVSAWLKCHHPTAFYAGLLNSQPMGFYSPSQLIQDARRHHIMVLPIDVNHSSWDHQILSSADQQQPPIRLGLRLIKGLSETAGKRIHTAQRLRAFASVADLRQRACLDRGDMEALAAADALSGISGNRYQSHWQTMALEDHRPLLPNDAAVHRLQDDEVVTAAPTLPEEVIADYQSTGLTLRSHPLALLRHQQPFDRCRRQAELEMLGNHRFVRVAGLVTCRQRPGTASGVVFLTLEDETGNINVIVWPAIQERYRQSLMTARLLLVKGTVESRDGVTHVIAGTLEDCSDRLSALAVQSRDFH